MISSFWSRWLIGVTLGVIGFGALLMGAAFPGLDGPTLALLTLLNGQAPQFNDTLRFSTGLMGAVSFGWGVTLFVVVRAALTNAELGARLWRPLTLGLVAWFIPDCIISVSTGFALNVVTNLVVLTAWIIPLQVCGLLRRQP